MIFLVNSDIGHARFHLRSRHSHPVLREFTSGEIIVMLASGRSLHAISWEKEPHGIGRLVCSMQRLEVARPRLNPRTRYCIIGLKRKRYTSVSRANLSREVDACRKLASPVTALKLVVLSSKRNKEVIASSKTCGASDSHSKANVTHASKSVGL